MTTNAICAACNNGWMSNLENQAKPLVEPMLHGRGRVFHRAHQR